MTTRPASRLSSGARRVVAFTVAIVAATSAWAGAGPHASAAATQAAPQQEPAAVPGELLVGYRPGATPEQRANARSRAGAQLQDRVVRGAAGRGEVELVRLPNGADRAATARRLQKDPAVAYAEPNWIVRHAAASNDPYVTDGRLWGVYGDASSPANPFGSQAAEAWTAGSTGSSTVYVGVIDEGIDYRHPDLADNIGRNPGEWGDGKDTNGTDDDDNGYVDDAYGWDFNGGDNTVYDGGNGDKHGTHVAGTIGARGNNGRGVAGVSWNVKMLSGKFLGPRGGTTANAVKAVRYFTDLKTRHNIDVVATNNSWGGGGYSQALYDAIAAAGVANILFIAAAGNDGADNDATARYPSGYTLDNIIAVASITKEGALSSFSNYGDTSVDLGAPGSDVWSTLPGNTYGSYNGTSMATPHVSGAAALYRSTAPTATAAGVKGAILGGAAATPSLNGKTVTGGRLDVSGFTAGAAPVVTITAPAAGATVSTATVDVAAMVTDADGMTGMIVQWRVDDGAWLPMSGAGGSYTATWDSTTVYDGSHTVAVRATDGTGKATTASVTVTSANSNPPPAPTLVLALTGTSKMYANGWTATATSRVTSSPDGAAVAGAVVSGRWSYSSSTVTCTTGPNGSCSITSGALSKKTAAVEFTVTSVSMAGFETISPNETIRINKP